MSVCVYRMSVCLFVGDSSLYKCSYTVAVYCAARIYSWMAYGTPVRYCIRYLYEYSKSTVPTSTVPTSILAWRRLRYRLRGLFRDYSVLVRVVSPSLSLSLSLPLPLPLPLHLPLSLCVCECVCVCVCLCMCVCACVCVCLKCMITHTHAHTHTHTHTHTG